MREPDLTLLPPNQANAYKAANEGFITIQEGEPLDIALFLKLSTQVGWAVNFSALEAFITEDDVTIEARRDAIASAISGKIFQCLAQGTFRDLRGTKALLTRIGVDHLELSNEIIDTMQELNTRVGDGVYSNAPTSYDGKCLINGKWVDQATAYRLHEIGILIRAGYQPEEAETMLPKFHIYKHILQALREGRRFDKSGFFDYALDLFTPNQAQMVLTFTQIRQLPAAE